MKLIFASFLLFFSIACFAQNQTATIQGRIRSESGYGIPNVSVYVGKLHVLSNPKGYYSCTISANDSVEIVFSHINYQLYSQKIYANGGKPITISPILKSNDVNIGTVVKVSNKSRENSSTYLSSEKTLDIAGLGVTGVEGSIKTMAGVTSKSELSSQYSVRGGSYDENLVYINGIQANKPNITSSDKQEGLSIINPYMVGSIEFSNGGFGAQYGDKLSSVLSVQYKDVKTFETQISGSLMDAAITTQGFFDSSEVTYIAGFRYKNTTLLLNSLDEKGEYKPEFYDFQSMITYPITNKTKISYWAYGANNTYKFIPSTRVTEFGGLSTQLRMTVYFEGNEQYKYSQFGNAIILHYNPRPNTQLIFNVFNNIADENETYDILGQYHLSELQKENQSISDTSGLLSIGTFLEHGRNSLQRSNWYLSHSGKHIFPFASIAWGIQSNINSYDGKYNSWTYLDSSNYSIPHNDTIIEFKNVKNASILHNVSKHALFVQATKRYSFTNNAETSLFINLGLRSTYDTYHNTVLYNPRLRLFCKPKKNDDLGITLSTGIYYQPAEFKELISKTGEFYTDLLPQKSTETILGFSKNILIWKRSFYWQTELFYKYLENIIPYTIQNVNTVYYPDLRANGYTSGFETKLNGEFVPGIESWVSVTLLNTKEHLQNNSTESIRRPNDQRFNFSMFFQDYLPNSKDFKMSLTYLFGTNIPLSEPNATYVDFDNYEIPSYTRVDIGFIWVLTNRIPKSWKLNNITAGAEVFNLFNNANKISYFWIEDVKGSYWAIPNYLTSRRINIKLAISI